METHFPDMNENPRHVARQRVMADLKALASDAEALLRATADDASDKAKEARVRLSAAIDKARTTCEELQAQGMEAAREAARKADETIRTHPYESIGIAFGVGVLLGALLRRR